MNLEDAFVKEQILIWGEDYVEDLIERGYAPVETNVGWKWILCESAESFLNRHNRLTAA